MERACKLPPCPDCSRPMRLIFDQPGKPREFICAIALEAKERGFLGQPGRIHNAVIIWEEKIRNGDN